MKTRLIPPFAALAALAACVFVCPPKNTADVPHPAFCEPLLPDAVELPTPVDIPDEITIFGAKHAESRSVAVAHESSAKVGYRLCSYAGGDGLWVVGVQDGAGHYFTLRCGERIPGTSLEFRNIRFRTSDSGLQTGDAVFFDNAGMNFVDVMACSTTQGSQADNPLAK
jgi:hypothetical protein